MLSWRTRLYVLLPFDCLLAGFFLFNVLSSETFRPVPFFFLFLAGMMAGMDLRLIRDGRAEERRREAWLTDRIDLPPRRGE